VAIRVLASIELQRHHIMPAGNIRSIQADCRRLLEDRSFFPSDHLRWRSRPVTISIRAIGHIAPSLTTKSQSPHRGDRSRTSKRKSVRQIGRDGRACRACAAIPAAVCTRLISSSASRRNFPVLASLGGGEKEATTRRRFGRPWM
jgi:hypothetical protein